MGNLANCLGSQNKMLWPRHVGCKFMLAAPLAKKGGGSEKTLEYCGQPSGQLSKRWEEQEASFWLTLHTEVSFLFAGKVPPRKETAAHSAWMHFDKPPKIAHSTHTARFTVYHCVALWPPCTSLFPTQRDGKLETVDIRQSRTGYNNLPHH